MRVFVVFICACLLAGFIIYSMPPYRQAVINLFSYSECDSPIDYKIGAIDPKFDLTTSEVSNDVQSAVGIWDSISGKELFADTSNAKLIISFVYDQRAALDSQINQLQNQLGQKNSTLQSQIDDFEAQSADFEKRLSDFNAEVRLYNSQGGAPEEVYKSLTDEQSKLKSEGDSLNARAKDLKLATHDYNQGVESLNQDVTQFNNALSQKPEEGLYDGQNDTITIYFANKHDELVHTLAHELGHALGMQHVGDKDAIMYPFTTSSLKVTSADKSQLSYVCREQSLPLHWIDLAHMWIYTTAHPYIQFAGTWISTHIAKK